MFDHVLDDDYKRLEMKLTGVVTYYGRHYTSFFYNIREKQWLFFDDAHVKKVYTLSLQSTLFHCTRFLVKERQRIGS